MKQEKGFLGLIKSIRFYSIELRINKIFTSILLISMLAFFSGCGKAGLYSIIVFNRGVENEPNELNNLSNSYKDKKLVFPRAIMTMSAEEKRKWQDTLNQYQVHTIDTSVKIGFLKIPGVVEVEIPACGKKGVAIVKLDAVSSRKRGKVIDLKLSYVCKDDNPNVNWEQPGKFWAATPSHKIDVKDPDNDCYDGFYSVEFQFVPEKENPVLRSVLMICADE